MSTRIAPDERYEAMKTVADWNWWFGMNGTEPHSIAGLVTNLGNTYCAKCVSHVNVFELSDTAKFIHADERFCGVCHGCAVSICNCKIEG
jgi:hypothetical protein